MCLELCLDVFKDGSTKIKVSLPPGAGKTVTFASLPERLQVLSGDPEETRYLVIVDGTELARQAGDHPGTEPPPPLDC